MPPLISVILPVYNTEKYVSDAIESVLNQTYPNIELICVNDGSKDESLKILQSFSDRIHLIDNAQNGGIAHARNAGIKIAHGEYIAFMDADDLWEATKLAVQMKQFEMNPSLDICFSFMKCFVSPELSEQEKSNRFCPPDPIPGYVSATALVKTTSFHCVGAFNEKWRMGEFIDWFERAKEAGLTYKLVEDVFLQRRIHETNTGVTERVNRSDYLKIIKEALDRKKQSI